MLDTHMREIGKAGKSLGSIRRFGAAALLIGGALLMVAAPGAATQARLTEAYGKIPLQFEVNKGQVDRAVQFLCRGRDYTLFLTTQEAVFALRGPQHEGAIVQLAVAGGNRQPRLAGEDRLPAESNYFLSNDPQQWHTHVANYARVRYQGVYPGVDLVFRGNQRQLEYDFIVAPGADPARIRLAFRGAEAMRIGTGGELVLHTASGDLVQPVPTVYQETSRGRKRVAGRYVLLSAPAERVERGAVVPLEVGFAVGPYDHIRPLVIDPMLVYSTFLGGSDSDNALSITVDGTGNAYVTGMTSSATFPGIGGSSIQPALNGPSDAFVTKINATGSAIVYSTFLGGSGIDVGEGIAVDGTGNVYVTGSTSSATFPGVTGSSIQPANGGGRDAFVTKINPTGTAILYSTFLGGSGNEFSGAIAIDSMGNTFVTGGTSSTTFPGVTASSLQPAAGGGGQDAFVTKINATGTAIVYSTFLGGSANDSALSIAADSMGDTWVTGGTSSTTFPGVTASSLQPAAGGGGDAFVTKINAAGTAIVYSTFLGGSGGDFGGGIAVDPVGDAYVTGNTSSAAFPGAGGSSIQPANGGSGDAFVTKIDPAGQAILYSTFLGGNGFDQGASIALDAVGNAYVTGSTDSTTLPGVTGSSIQPANGGGLDAFVAEINTTGTAIVYSTFLGGSGNDQGHVIGIDGAGSAYVTGVTFSATFPGANGSPIQPANQGGQDAFVTKIGKAGSPALTAQASPPQVVIGGSIRDTATLTGGASPTGTITFNLFGPDNATCTGNPIFTATKPVSGNGSYTSSPFTPMRLGTYRWVASYSGDPDNNAAGPTSCDDPAQAVIVTGFNAAIPTLDTLGLSVLALLLAILGFFSAKRTHA